MKVCGNGRTGYILGGLLFYFSQVEIYIYDFFGVDNGV
jgi:hypothetical protein